jgi:hypothetical protein
VIIPVSWAGVAEPLIEVSALTLGSFDVLSAAYAATGELVFAWDETCSGCGFKVATLPGAAASTITTPTRLPDGPAGTSVGGTVIAGAAVPTVQISHTNNTPYAAVDDGVGRFSAGAWSWHTWSLDTTLTERRSLLAPAPDGSLVAADTRDVSAMPGVVELRFARVVADTMTFTTITTAQTSGPTIGVDRGGTTHVLFSAPAVPYTAGALLQHAQISSTGQVTAPGVLWTGGGVQVATSPDGDVYGFERQRMLLVHLGP